MRFHVPAKIAGLAIFAISILNPAFADEPSSTSTTPSGSPGVGASKAFNPDTSVNFLTLIQRDTLRGNDRDRTPHNGMQLQEAEVQFFSDVDPYFTANALFSISKKTGSTDFGIDPEEVYAETTSIPVVTFKLGKFKAAFGKHNTLHTHAFPFIDAPLINQDLFTDEGLNEAGVSASILVPTPWFTELTLQGLGTGNETFLKSSNAGDIAQLVNLRNLWDLSNSTTVEWALYGIRGASAFSANSNAYGTDLILKWRPEEGGKYHALVFANEYINALVSQAGLVNAASFTRERLGGLASWLQYQFAERWWIQGRGEYEGIPHSAAFAIKRKQSALLGFNFSEFSAFRLQGDHQLTDGGSPHEYRIALQWNITIGAHPAHSY